MSEKPYVAVAKLSELTESGQKVVSFNGKSVLLCRSQGECFAVENLCSHEFTPLQGGTMAGGVIVCPLHGAEFDLRTGAALGPPAYDPLRVFAVRIAGDSIEISDSVE